MYIRHLHFFNETKKQKKTSEFCYDIRTKSLRVCKKQPTSRKRVDLRSMRPDAVPCPIPAECPKILSWLEEGSPNKIHVLRRFYFN